MKTKGRQSKNIEKGGSSYLDEAKGLAIAVKNELLDPKNSQIPGNAVVPKSVNDSMERAAKTDKLTNAKRAMDRTVKPGKTDNTPIFPHDTFDNDPATGKLRMRKGVVDKEDMERMTRDIQVTPGKWTTNYKQPRVNRKQDRLKP